jgi:hypothetical protein
MTAQLRSTIVYRPERTVQSDLSRALRSSHHIILTGVIMARRLRLLVALLTAALFAPSISSAQFPAVVANAGDSYGISVWAAGARQNSMKNEIVGYGVNIMYRPFSFWQEGEAITQQTIFNPRTCSDSSVCAKVVYYRFRASLGVGYLAYNSITSPATDLHSSFDVGGPYAGVLLAWHADRDQTLDVNLGYRLALPFSSAVIGQYTGPRLAGITDTPVTFNIPATASHEVSLGLTLIKSIFIEGFVTRYVVRDVLYTALNKSIPADELQNALGNEIDLGFTGVRLGYSHSF